jgi:hypothetical protein
MVKYSWTTHMLNVVILSQPSVPVEVKQVLLQGNTCYFILVIVIKALMCLDSYSMLYPLGAGMGSLESPSGK